MTTWILHWSFYAGCSTREVWSGGLCTAHEPLDQDGHLKPRALARYMRRFPEEAPLPPDTTGTMWTSAEPDEVCFVCTIVERERTNMAWFEQALSGEGTI